MGSTFGAFRPPAYLALGGNAHTEELRGLAARALSSSTVASGASAGGGASESTVEPRSTSSASLASGVCDTDESVDNASDAEDALKGRSQDLQVRSRRQLDQAERLSRQVEDATLDLFKLDKSSQALVEDFQTGALKKRLFNVLDARFEKLLADRE